MSLARLASLALLSLISACGYSTTLRLPEGHESVAVEVFANDSPLPVLERALYSSLDANVGRMVSAPLKAPSRADLVVRGRIIDYYRLAGVFDKEGGLAGSGVVLLVRAWLVDTRTGERVGAEWQWSREVRYAIQVGQSESGALELALTTLSQELVLDLFSQANYDLTEPSGAQLPAEIPPELRDAARDE